MSSCATTILALRFLTQPTNTIGCGVGAGSKTLVERCHALMADGI